jgi:hypothetical protein
MKKRFAIALGLMTILPIGLKLMYHMTQSWLWALAPSLVAVVLIVAGVIVVWILRSIA